MAAYVINDMEITDPVVFEQYRQMTPATLVQYGGRFIVRGGAIEPLEGAWSPRRLVILEFATAEQARAWIDSPEYAPARRQRQASARSSMILVEGVAATPVG
jgi:uncharacterized protein (DUF1330 family)